MRFRSTLSAEAQAQDINIFNAVSIFVPKSLASANLESASYDPSAIDADKYGVITVTVDNYKSIFKSTGNLYSQWLPVFNGDTNFNVTLYVIIFDDTGFSPTLGASAISWAPLTKAFNELYFISFFKTMFADDYKTMLDVTSGTPDTYALSNGAYCDLALCLASLCEGEGTMSLCLVQNTVELPSAAFPDTEDTDGSNAVRILEKTRGGETAGITTFVGTTDIDRAKYFWGALHLIGGKHAWQITHNGVFMFPVILSTWFESKNASGEFVGNQLAKIRLTDSKVKPTGLPSPLDSDINLNLTDPYRTNLEAKYSQYLESIGDGTGNNARVTGDRTVDGFPVTAYMMSKWIDYNASLAMARYVTDRSTLTDPVLCNEAAYNDLQNILGNVISVMVRTGRLRNVQLSFPPFSEAKVGQSFKGTAVWSAVYELDLDKVEVSGSITF